MKQIYLGRSLFTPLPAYFKSSLPAPARTFLSPNFIRTPDRKGIQILYSLILNLLLAPLYLFEACRIGIMMRRDRSDTVVNFYDPVGALAGRWWKRGAKRLVISHHFYLSHPDFIHPHGLERAYFWLQLMNRIMMRSAHRVIALSFRKGEDAGRITVLPPLIDERVRQGEYVAGERDLCYFLNPGFVEEMIGYYKNHPDLQADIFTDEQPSAAIPDNVQVHTPSRKVFLSAMLRCSRIICTAGFDTIAEAFYLGVPLFLIPTVNHYEQYCNALDAARTGMAFQLEELLDMEDFSNPDKVEFVPAGNRKYREWADSLEDSLLGLLERVA
ncbi:MAG: glycosyltransferase family protein [Bacteroidales bacterium]